MLTEADFLAAVLAEPEDDAPRLIMADWLDEQGQGERAEFIRVQCELARMRRTAGDDPDSQIVLEMESVNIEERERELMTGERAALWCGPALRTLVADLTHDLIAKHRPVVGPFVWRCGFVHAIAISWVVCRDHLDAILAEQPVREVELTTWPSVTHHVFDGSGPLAALAGVHYQPGSGEWAEDIARNLLRLLWPYVQKWELPPYPNWRNYTDVYSVIDRGDFTRRAREALPYLHMTPPL